MRPDRLRPGLQRAEARLRWPGLTADPARPETARVETELARVMRSRILNPKWLEGLKRHATRAPRSCPPPLTPFWLGRGGGGGLQLDVRRMARQFLLDEETRRWMEQVKTRRCSR